MDRATTLRHITEGQFEGLTQVIEINPVECICRDVTEDFALDVMRIWARSGEPLTDWQREYVELHVSVQAANSFRRAA